MSDPGIDALCDAIDLTAIANYVSEAEAWKARVRMAEIRALQEITKQCPILGRASLVWLRDVINRVYLPGCENP